MKFSIAIPAYKASYLKECIDSILCQDYNDFELIIVNDASPENVEEIVQSYSDLRIQYYCNTVNCGAIKVVDNWNKCLQYAKGQFFILMGDDDKMEPHYLSAFLAVINQYPEKKIFHCQSKIINEKSEIINHTSKLPTTESLLEMMYQRIVKNRHQYISDFVYDTEMLQSKGGFYSLPLAQMSDDISAYIMAQEFGIANVTEYVFLYRSHGTTISSQGAEEETLQAIQLSFHWLTERLASMTEQEKSERLYKKVQSKSKKSFHRKRVSVLIRAIKGNRRNCFKKLIAFKRRNYVTYTDICISIVQYCK